MNEQEQASCGKEAHEDNGSRNQFLEIERGEFEFIVVFFSHESVESLTSLSNNNNDTREEKHSHSHKIFRHQVFYPYQQTQGKANSQEAQDKCCPALNSSFNVGEKSDEGAEHPDEQGDNQKLIEKLL